MNKTARVKVRVKSYKLDYLKKMLDNLHPPKVPPLPSWPPKEHWPPKTRGCTVCGIGSDGGTLGYVCPRGDCPSRITCVNPYQTMWEAC